MNHPWRQLLHVEPKAGWLNDPNGLSDFGGLHQLYYQSSPDDPAGGGRKCWAHRTSKDFFHWSEEETVLFPDLPEDRSGVYSGSAVVLPHEIRLFYTGNVKEPGEHDYILSGRQANVIAVTTLDGSTMSPKRVLLRNGDYPADCSCHVRDPKVWKEEGIWKMVLGARTRSDHGCVLLYHSEDLTHWTFASRCTKPDFGYMWECPDFFRLGDQGFLSVSPQGLQHEPYRYQNVYQSGYFPVTGRLEEGRLGEFTEWDYGFDFYAPQTYQTADGRRVLYGWMGIPDGDYRNPTTDLGWQHCLTLPREVEAENAVLFQRPVRELEGLLDPPEAVSSNGVLPPACVLKLTRTAPCFALTLAEGLKLEYQEETGVFALDFTDEALGAGRKRRQSKGMACRRLEIVVDTSSVEVYLDGGRQVFSSRFYPRTHPVQYALTGATGTVCAVSL